MKPADF
ncbi:hypothetical protein CGLO_16129 [Colletotrichum gloeosporioides Cg-14]|nr:hypothetical protein CGLO_16129 [Colletotrichum gloeosporioides Cg-14]